MRWNWKMALGLGMIGALALLGILAPLLSHADPAATDLMLRLKPPGTVGLLGTDHLGRDMLARVLYGTRCSMGVSFLILGVSVLTGTLLGLLSGYFGGMADGAISSVMEVLLAFPGLILSLTVVGILGPGLWHTVWAICLTSWIGYARLVRGMTLTLREKEFVKAAVLGGCSHWAILGRHILPNLLGNVAIYAAANVGSITAQLASLSFLGLGAQPSTPEWGAMLNEAKGFLSVAPWMAIFPGVALVWMACGFHLFGDGLAGLLRQDPQGSSDGKECGKGGAFTGGRTL